MLEKGNRDYGIPCKYALTAESTRCNVSLDPDEHEGVNDVQRIRPPAATSCKDDHAGLAGMRGKIGSMRGRGISSAYLFPDFLPDDTGHL
jgi:hypothetical protein